MRLGTVFQALASVSVAASLASGVMGAAALDHLAGHAAERRTELCAGRLGGRRGGRGL
jgi:hypothetical protein